MPCPKSLKVFIEKHLPVFYTGVGKINATMVATKCILEEKPDLIINFGTAGSNSINKHTLVDCTKFIERDMNIEELGFELGQTPYEDKELSFLEFASNNPINENKTCGTGDTFVSDMSGLPCDVVDMEAYAIAKCCFLNNVDFVSYKYITDGADEDAATDWLDNCKKASNAFVEIINYYKK